MGRLKGFDDRTFNGLSFEYNSTYGNKGEAEAAAVHHRRLGHKARVVKVPVKAHPNWRGGRQYAYNVYVRRT